MIGFDYVKILTANRRTKQKGSRRKPATEHQPISPIYHLLSSHDKESKTRLMSHPKRRHHSDRLSSSSDVSDTEPSLALHHRRKRRLISSDEEAPSSCDGMFGFRAQTKKRRHDDVYSEEEEDLQPNPSFPADHHPPTKRLRKGLSDGFTRLGIREGAEPETRRQTMPTEPSSVVVPGEGEVGPAVWLRHADSVVEEEQEEGERVKYVVVGEDGEEQELSGKEVALWTGNKRAAVKGPHRLTA